MFDWNVNRTPTTTTHDLHNLCTTVGLKMLKYLVLISSHRYTVLQQNVNSADRIDVSGDVYTTNMTG
jgi:hypothetical protein